jgi:ribokinase
MKVLVVGSLNMDLSISCARVPAAGETVEGDAFLTNPGGKGANQAVAAARLGACVAMAGAVGDDAFGRTLVACVEAAGVDATHVEHLPDVATGTAVIVRSGGDNRIILVAGANGELTGAMVDAALAACAPGDVLVTQLENPLPQVEEALAHAHERGLFTVFNPAPARELPPEFWRHVDCVCLNETECELMCGIYPYGPEEASLAAAKLCELGPREVIITMGERGVFGRCPVSEQAGAPAAAAAAHAEKNGEVARSRCVREEEAQVPAVCEEHFVPARRVKAVDTTGAGDTFIGALLAARSRGFDFVGQLEYATCASSLAVQALGAMQAIPTQAQVDKELAR